MLLALCFSWIAKGQDDVRYYEKEYLNLFEMAHSWSDPNQTTIYKEAMEHMESLLLMYEATNNVDYLQIFIQYASNVIQTRDDLRSSAVYYNGSAPYPNIQNYSGVASATWSTNIYNSAASTVPYPHQLNNAGIIYPIVKFCNIVKGNTTLEDTDVNSSITLDNPITNLKANVNYFKHYMNPTKKFIDVIGDFLVESEKTIEFYDNKGCWEQINLTTGAYKELDFVGARFPNIKLPMNVQSSIGRALLQLYLATNKQEYLNKVRALGKYIIDNTSLPDPYNIAMNQNNPNFPNTWLYWGKETYNPEYPTLLKPNREDIDHSALTAIFPLECNLNGITVANGSSDLLFTNNEISQYANTLIKDFYINPLIMREGVNNKHTDLINIWNYKTNTSVAGSGVLSNPSLYQFEHWIAYSQKDPKIYQILTDFTTSKYYVGENGDNGNSSIIKNIRILAYLAKHAQTFVPIAAEHGWGGDSKWLGAARGNFDANAIDGEEIVVLRDFKNQIMIQQKMQGKAKMESMLEIFEPNDYNNGIGLFPETPNDTLNPFDYKWAGVAAGDFFDDTKDEFIVLSNMPVTDRNGFYTFKFNAQNKIEFDKNKSGLTFGSASQWAGITAGNFVAGGKDDFIIARNYDRRIYVYKCLNNTVYYEAMMTLDAIIGANSNIAAIASGDIDGLTGNGDELVVLVNGPGTESGVYVFNVNTSNSTPLSLLVQMPGWGSGGEFRGLAVGNFDGTGADEIVIHRNHDAHYRVYGYDGSQLTGKGADLFDVRQTKDNILVAGNFYTSSTNDELVAYRNVDAGVIMYNAATYKTSSTSNMINQELLSMDNPITIDEQEEIKVYPNPNLGVFNIDLGVTDKQARVLVFDIKGMHVLSRELTQQQSKIDMSTFQSGMYLVKIVSGDTVITKKIMKL